MDARSARYQALSHDPAVLLFPETAALTAVFGAVLAGPTVTTRDLMLALAVSGSAALRMSPVSPFYWRAAALDLVECQTATGSGPL